MEMPLLSRMNSNKPLRSIASALLSTSIIFRCTHESAWTRPFATWSWTLSKIFCKVLNRSTLSLRWSQIMLKLYSKDLKFWWCWETQMKHLMIWRLPKKLVTWVPWVMVTNNLTRSTLTRNFSKQKLLAKITRLRLTMKFWTSSSLRLTKRSRSDSTSSRSFGIQITTYFRLTPPESSRRSKTLTMCFQTWSREVSMTKSLQKLRRSQRTIQRRRIAMKTHTEFEWSSK